MHRYGDSLPRVSRLSLDHRQGALRLGLPAPPAPTLFGVGVRSRRGDGTGLRGLLRRGGSAVCFIRSAAGNEGDDSDGEAGNDKFFHPARLAARSVTGYGVEPYFAGL